MQLPASAKQHFDRVQRDYGRWMEAEDEFFATDQLDTVRQSLKDALLLFIQEAVRGGVDRGEVVEALRRRFPALMGESLFEVALAGEPRDHSPFDAGGATRPSSGVLRAKGVGDVRWRVREDGITDGAKPPTLIPFDSITSVGLAYGTSGLSVTYVTEARNDPFTTFHIRCETIKAALDTYEGIASHIAVDVVHPSRFGTVTTHREGAEALYRKAASRRAARSELAATHKVIMKITIVLIVLMLLVAWAGLLGSSGSRHGSGTGITRGFLDWQNDTYVK